MNYLVCVMFYFQFFGMYNLSIHRDPGRERLLFYWTWIHLAGLATLTFIIIHFAGKIFFIVDTLGTVADVIQVAAPLLTHYIIIVESLCTRRIRLKILDRMAEVDKLYPSLIIARAKQIQIRRYFNKLVATQALCIFFELCIMHGISANELWTRHWYVSIYVFIICRSQHLFYVYYVDLVKCRLDVVAGELKNVGSLLHSDDVSVSMVKLYGQIKQAKKAYSSIWEMVQFIEMAFGWSMFSNIISNFICLTVNLYWNYASLLYIESNNFWKESVMCSFPLIIAFYVLFSSCDSCIQTFNVLKTMLHKIDKNPQNKELNSLIHQFSLQMLHAKIEFSVKGFFSVDLELLKGIITAITTYLVIFIQFMPKKDVFKDYQTS